MLDKFNMFVDVFVKYGFTIENANIISSILFSFSLISAIFVVVLLPYFIICLINWLLPLKWYLFWDSNQCFYIHYGFYSKITKKLVEKKYKTKIVMVEKYPTKELLYASLANSSGGFYNSLECKYVFKDEEFYGG